MTDSQIALTGIFPEHNPLAGVSAEDVGQEIAAALELTSALARETAELLDTCTQWVKRYIIVSDEQAVILSAWILHTYAPESAECTPYIHITAPERECGKSNLMLTLNALAFNPVRSGGITAAALVRCIDAKNPTIFLDEMDAQLGGDKEYAETIRGILNEGFRKGGKFIKVEGRNHDLREFNAYCPKCLAGIGNLPETVSSRSIVIEMRRKTDMETVQSFREKELARAAKPIRERLEQWKANGVAERLSATMPKPIDGLSDRQNDISEPLLAIGTLAGTEWLTKLTGALLAILKGRHSGNVSTGVTLLRDIQAVFAEHTADKLFSKDLAAALCEIEGRPWADWNRGRGFKPNDLAKQLHKYGIYPRKLSIGMDKLQGYPIGEFKDAWERYCPVPVQPELPEPSELSASLLVKNGSGLVPVPTSGEKEPEPSDPHKQRGVPAVPAVPALQEQGVLRI